MHNHYNISDERHAIPNTDNPNAVLSINHLEPARSCTQGHRPYTYFTLVIVLASSGLGVLT